MSKQAKLLLLWPLVMTRNARQEQLTSSCQHLNCCEEVDSLPCAIVSIIYWKSISVIIPNQVKCLLFRNVSFVKPEGEETCPLKYFCKQTN